MFSKKLGANLTKLYFNKINLVSTDHLLELIMKLSSILNIDFKYASLNYSEDFSFKNLRTKLAKSNFCDIEYLEVIDETERFTVTIGDVFAYMDFEKKIFELRIILPIDESFTKEIELFNATKLTLKPFYGYSRGLPDNFSPVTEIKLKRTLFGSVKSVVQRADKQWYEHPEGISDGAIKGLYEVNYWLKNIKDLELKSILERLDINAITDVVELSAEQLKTIRSLHSKIKNYVHN